MGKLSLGAAILLLSATWTLAQASTPPTDQSPTSSTQSTRQSGKSQAATIEGCLSSNVDAFVLTDANGKTYELTGDTTQLTERVGHKVRFWGHDDSTADAELITAGGPHAAFGVKKVHSLSAACKQVYCIQKMSLAESCTILGPELVVGTPKALRPEF